jgi:hypothetical protein
LFRDFFANEEGNVGHRSDGGDQTLDLTPLEEQKVADRDVSKKSNAGSNYMTIIYYLLMASSLFLDFFSLHFDDFQLDFSFCAVA